MPSQRDAHPLAELIAAAAGGRFPAADGGWRRVPPWRAGLGAIVSFTGHAVLAVQPDVVDEQLVKLGVNGFGGAHNPRVVAALAGENGWIDSLDVLLAGRGGGGAAALVDRPDLSTHARARFAAEIRDRVRVLGYPDQRRTALAVVCRGLAGLTEVSFELEPQYRGAGAGAELLRAALNTIPAGQVVVAAAAPGNAASLRALLSAGFRPLGSLQLFRPARR